MRNNFIKDTVKKLTKLSYSDYHFAAGKGFTLIELLIVIGILGVLAAALLATIDPLEQTRKARDTSLKNAATEFLGANQRYYVNRNALPWHATVDGGEACYSGGATLSAIRINALTNCITALLNASELKQSFANASNLDQLYVTNPSPQTNDAKDMIVCFIPQSKLQQRDAQARYTQTGANGTNCKATGGTVNCYWCAQ